MEKTLQIKLDEQRQMIVSALDKSLYKELSENHSGCEFQDSIENKCNCELGAIFTVIEGVCDGE